MYALSHIYTYIHTNLHAYYDTKPCFCKIRTKCYSNRGDGKYIRACTHTDRVGTWSLFKRAVVERGNADKTSAEKTLI